MYSASDWPVHLGQSDITRSLNLTRSSECSVQRRDGVVWVEDGEDGEDEARGLEEAQKRFVEIQCSVVLLLDRFK